MKPVLQSLVVAEHIYEDKSGKKIIAGTFNRVLFKKKAPLCPPTEHPGAGAVSRSARGTGAGDPWLYISVTDVCDDTELKVQLVNLSKNMVIFENTFTIHCDDRLRTIEIISPTPPLTLDEAGTYAFEVVCEGEILGSHRIIAQEAP